MKLIPFLLVWMIGFSASAGPIIVGNGGGLMELQFVFAWKNLESLIETCQFVPQCGLAPETGSQLLNTLQSPQQNLNFESAQRAPHHFIFNFDGTALVFGTLAKPGSRVYINTDLLYTGFPDALDLPQIIGSLTSAVAVQSGLSLEKSLEAGQILSFFWRQDFQSFSLREAQLQQIQLNVFNQTEAEVLLFDASRSYILTQSLKENLEEVFNTGPVALKSFSSIFWNSESLGEKTLVTLNARILFQNEEGQSIEGWTVITFQVSPQDGGLIEENSLKIEFMDLKAE